MARLGHAAGLDVGGTKIAAQLFDETWNVIDAREVATPKTSYASLLNVIVDEINWLHAIGDGVQIPIGIGLPGIVDPRTGAVLTANLPASGHPLWQDLVQRLAGFDPVIINDCRAFALSEAVLGAGHDHETVVGLVIGTGLAGGLVFGGNLIKGSNGAAGEFGHIPIPTHLLQKYDLPVLRCGCGRSGCYETLGSGVGLSRIAKHVTGEDIDASAFAKNPDHIAPDLQRCLTIWIDLLSELVMELCLTVDPDCIVLGGGASKAPGLVSGLTNALDRKLLTAMTGPMICLAQGGPQSGARGAAFAAVMARNAKGS